MPDTEIPVLIIGGGMSGLASALFLRQQGVDCMVIERNTSTSQLLRSTHVSPRTMELFRTLGIEGAVRDVAERFVLGKHWSDPELPPHHLPRVILRAKSLADIVEGDVLVMAEGENDFHDIGPAEAVWCGQDKVEPIMFEEAVRRGARVNFNTEMVSFEADADGVTTVIRDRATGEENTVRSRYLIAADGAHGSIRKTLGIQRSGHGTLGHVFNILFKADIDAVLDGRRFMILYLLNREAPGMLFKLDDQRWIFGLFCDPEFIAEGGASPERCVELVRAALGEPDLDIDIQTTMGWWIGHGIADTYSSGRVFLVGDACHVLPPTGGFGANAGIQDASNLAWKLAGVLQGWADERLLDTYETERRPVGSVTIDQAWMRHVRWSNPQDTTIHDERDQTIVTTAYRYSSPAIIGADHDEVLGRELEIDGRPGMRVPHVWLTRAGEKVSSVDLPGESFVLLAGTDGSAWVTAGCTVARRLGIPLEAHQIGPQHQLADHQGTFKKASGISSRGAVLIRPDGFVAWRSEDVEADPDRVLARVLSTVTSRA
ncbi:FAD-dependent monooxygenase [Kitasatospora sp. NPDC001119]